MRTFPRFASLIALFLVWASACDIIAFDIEEPLAAQTIQGSPLGSVLPLTLFEIPMQSDIAAQTEARGTGPATSAHLKNITLVIKTPADETFSFMESISIKIVAEGLPEKEVARLVPVPATKSISLEIVPNVNLLPYIHKGATMRAAATGRMPSRTITFDGKVVVRVKV